LIEIGEEWIRVIDVEEHITNGIKRAAKGENDFSCQIIKNDGMEMVNARPHVGKEGRGDGQVRRVSRYYVPQKRDRPYGSIGLDKDMFEGRSKHL
jgi:hypothetical protein